VTLTVDPIDFKTALPVTHDVYNLSYNFEHGMVFGFRVNGGHATDGQTNRVTDGRV